MALKSLAQIYFEPIQSLGVRTAKRAFDPLADGGSSQVIGLW